MLTVRFIYRVIISFCLFLITTAINKTNFSSIKFDKMQENFEIQLIRGDIWYYI